MCLWLTVSSPPPQAKEEYQKVMMQLMEDRLHHEGAISEYKEVCFSMIATVEYSY